jgi:hypothetical protein
MVKSIVAMALLMLSSTALRVDSILHDNRVKHDPKIYHDRRRIIYQPHDATNKIYHDSPAP